MSSATATSILQIDDHNFECDILQAELPVLVDFWAVWCPPCRTIASHVEALAQKYAGRLVVGKCDFDGNQESAARYDVRSAPTLMLFKGGKAIGQIVGAAPRAKIEAFVERAF